MPAITLKIGAKLDSSAVNVFGPLIASANRAKTQIAKLGQEAAKEYVGGYRDAPAHLKKGFDQGADAAASAGKKIVASGKDAAKEAAKDAEYVFKIKQRYLAEEEKASARLAAQNQKTFAKGRADAAAYQASVGAERRGILDRGVSSGVGMIRGALGVAGQIARGAGVETNVGALIGKVGGQQQAAVGVSNAGYLEGEKGAAGQRQDPAVILGEARKAADVARMSTSDVLAGLQSFTDKTTDLETGRALLERMAVLSKSTGSNMVDVSSAAGALGAKLGDIPDKAEAIAALMSMIAKQGKIGSVAMSAMASNIAGFTGPAKQFAEGPGKAIGELGAVFQVTQKSGYAKGAAQASTYTSRFAGDLTSAAGLKAMHKSGIKDEDIFADKGKTKLKSLSEILSTMLNKAGGDLTKLSAIAPNKGSGSVLKAFNDVWVAAEKVKKGSGGDAVTAKIKEYGGATSDADTKGALAAANNTTESKVQLFNNQLERVAETTAARVLPAMEKLGPDMVKLAGGMGDLAVYVAENPLKSAVAAMGAGIAKEVAAAGIKKMIEGALSSSLGGAGGAVILAAGAIMTITDATITMTAKAEDTARDKSVAVEQTRHELRMAMQNGDVSDDTIKNDAKQQLELQARITAAEGANNFNSANPLTSLIGDVSGAANYITAGSVGTSFAAQANQGEDKANLGALKAQLEGMKAESAKVHQALTSGTLKVMVMNPAALGGDKPGTTTGPGAVR